MKEQQAQAKRSHQRKEEEATRNRFMGFCEENTTSSPPSSPLQALSPLQASPRESPLSPLEVPSKTLEGGLKGGLKGHLLKGVLREA